MNGAYTALIAFSFISMIPGNGIETAKFSLILGCLIAFISMIPGNGIEIAVYTPYIVI